MFNHDEQAVIRTYISIMGEPLGQARFEAAFEYTGLRAFTTELMSDRPAQSNSAFVTNLYENLLNRVPDTEGFEYWTALLNAGQIGKARLAVEFQNAAALNADSEPDFEGGSFGLTPINGSFLFSRVSAIANPENTPFSGKDMPSKGDGSVKVEVSLSDSDDETVDFSGDERAVIRVFVALTGEPPSQAELESAFEGCSNFYDLCHDLATESLELSDSEFVTMLYQNLLGRQPDPDGLTYWSSLLDETSGKNQQSKWGLAGHFQNTAALNAAFEDGLVDGTFGLEPTGEIFGPPKPVPLPSLPSEDILYPRDFANQVLDLEIGRGEQIRLVYEGYDNGEVTVNNFIQDIDGQAGRSVAGIDRLDFTDYFFSYVELDSVCHPLSLAPVEFLGSADELIGNTVSIITFQGAGDSAGQNWEGLDAPDLVSLLNGAEAYGDAANTSEFGNYDPDNSDSAMKGYLGGIKGGINSHIFMIENDTNAGEYKLFLVTSTLVDDSEVGNFDAGAKLIGILDFGASLSTNEFDMEDSLVGADALT